MLYLDIYIYIYECCTWTSVSGYKEGLGQGCAATVVPRIPDASFTKHKKPIFVYRTNPIPVFRITAVLFDY